MKAMFSSMGVLAVDHYSVTTQDLIETLKDFLSIPNSKLLRGPGKNEVQKVNYAFVELNGMGVVKILSPLSNDSPIMSHISKGAGAYHLCYLVKHLETAIKTAEEKFNAKLIVSPKVDGAFDGRKVAFLVHPLHGLFELLEAYPSSIEPDLVKTELVKTKCSENKKILEIYNNVMQTNETNLNLVNMKQCEEWDSLKHLLFIMELEKQFEINISAKDLGKLNDLRKIQAYIDNK